MQFLSQTLDRGLHGGDVVVIGVQLGPCGSARFGIFVVGFDLPRPPLQLPSSLAHSDPRAGAVCTAAGVNPDHYRVWTHEGPAATAPATSCAASFRDVWPGAPGRGQLAPFSSGIQLTLAERTSVGPQILPADQVVLGPTGELAGRICG